ncbi:ABC transporter ATP-binding protein [Aquirufa regiilacus]|uniref:ABC transporter transmembrane domain-containing protein n=1 Tax=Aquirufa regiilacus TaxID=3024868 RepID=A0ABU3TNG2_9BACT|nr:MULTISPECIES: ABC transporter transmembrane domain-containing protein [unclassified Aquirufa]MDT8888080.1 ABC transporter transmembrane domain-containing protein [Aquirufa sp. LEPPI-3A]MDU0807410.1 ABC transporter transmembrane domain-containing protein [Aquirufa sp. LEOWEIH-7C]
MAKRHESFGSGPEPKDKVKVDKQGLKKALKIFQFVIPYKWTFITGMLFLLLSNLTTMSFPLLIGQMTKVIEGKSNYHINEVTLFFFAVLIIQAILSFLRIYTFAQVSEKAMRDVRKNLYAKIITMPIFHFEKRRVGELMSRITSDITQLQDVLSITLAEFFRQVFTLVGGIALITYLSWKLTLFMLATFPVLVVAAIVFGKFIRKISKKSQDELAATNIIVEETFQSIQAVKSFTNESYEVNRYTSSLNRVIEAALKAATMRGAFVSFVIFALFGGIVGVVWYGAALVAQGDMILADLLTFIFYTAFIGGSVGGLGDIYAQLQKTIGSSDRILEILEDPSEIDLVSQESPKAIEFGKITIENVHFSYPSRPSVEILKGISIDIEPGQKIAIVGTSGTGKSTLAQLMMRFYEPNAGQIKLNGRNIQEYSVSDWRGMLALVPQEVLLFGGTIRENIAYGKPGASQEEIEFAAEQAFAKEFIESFPEKWETLVGERGVKLSGGQRQRIAIARAILRDPKFLILDEATSALDSESEKWVQSALEELMKNRTSLIIAHRLSTIRSADQIIVMEEGKILEQGNHDALMKIKNGVYRNMVALQTEYLQA